AGDEQHARRGGAVGHACREVGAAHHRHDDVGHEQVDALVCPFEQRDGGVTVGGGDDAVARPAQDLGHQRAHVGLVVDDQDGRGVVTVVGGQVENVGVGVGVGGGGGGDQRGEGEGEHGAVPAPAVDLDGATGATHDVVGGGEPQAGAEARRLGGE